MPTRIPIYRDDIFTRLDADKKEIMDQLLKMSLAFTQQQFDLSLDLTRFIEASDKDIKEKFGLIESNLKLLIRENNKKKK